MEPMQIVITLFPEEWAGPFRRFHVESSRYASDGRGIIEHPTLAEAIGKAVCWIADQRPETLEIRNLGGKVTARVEETP